jgi:hypothetical protein
VIKSLFPICNKVSTGIIWFIALKKNLTNYNFSHLFQGGFEHCSPNYLILWKPFIRYSTWFHHVSKFHSQVKFPIQERFNVTLTQTKVKSPHLLTKTHQEDSQFKPLQEALFPFITYFVSFHGNYIKMGEKKLKFFNF